MLEVAIVIGVTLLALLGGIPIAYCLGIGGAVGVSLTIGFQPVVAQIASTVFEAGFVYEFSVVPLFILMGNLIATGGVSDKLFDAARSFLGHRPGGLGMATAVACGGFSAVSGSSLATAAAMSKAAMPAMRRYGYSDGLATGVIAAGGSLGILIPPSIVLVFYAIMTNQNISEMFLAGVIPGLIGILGYVLTVGIIARVSPQKCLPGDRHPWKTRFRNLMKIGDSLILFAIVMGGLYGGIFTSTEAAAFGAIAALILVWARGALNMARLKAALMETGVTTGMLFCIYVGALFITAFINYSDLPQYLEDMIVYFELSRMQTVIVILAVCLLMGMVLEAFSIILLIVPVALPLLMALDVNLIWFGILLVVATEISLITPPVGMNVFVLKSINPNIELKTIFGGVIPFVIVDVVRLALLLGFPILSLWLVQTAA